MSRKGCTPRCCHSKPQETAVILLPKLRVAVLSNQDSPSQHLRAPIMCTAVVQQYSILLCNLIVNSVSENYQVGAFTVSHPTLRILSFPAVVIPNPVLRSSQQQPSGLCGPWGSDGTYCIPADTECYYSILLPLFLGPFWALPCQKVSLKLQKRLAASVLKCGKGKIWLDPNEVNEISLANSRQNIRKVCIVCVTCLLR